MVGMNEPHRQATISRTGLAFEGEFEEVIHSSTTTYVSFHLTESSFPSLSVSLLDSVLTYGLRQLACWQGNRTWSIWCSLSWCGY